MGRMMSREIKFRLVKDSEIVGYEKHTQNKGNFKSSIFHSKANDDTIGYEWSNITHFTEKFIDCDIKVQYTGLKDKFRNNKEVYEGDIYEWCGVRRAITVDDFHGYRFMFGKDVLCKAYIYEGKFIGNIHENKDLL